MALSPLSVVPDRSLTATLRRVEPVVWALCVVAVAALLAVTFLGAVVVSSQPLTLPALGLLFVALLGTAVFVGADVVFG